MLTALNLHFPELSLVNMNTTCPEGTTIKSTLQSCNSSLQGQFQVSTIFGSQS